MPPLAGAIRRRAPWEFFELPGPVLPRALYLEALSLLGDDLEAWPMIPGSSLLELEGDLLSWADGLAPQLLELVGVEAEAFHVEAFLMRFEAGAGLSPHPDSPEKLAGLVVYLGENAAEDGTRALGPAGEVAIAPFGPNRGIAFRRAAEHLHAVGPVSAPRASLLVGVFKARDWRLRCLPGYHLPTQEHPQWLP